MLRSVKYIATKDNHHNSETFTILHRNHSLARRLHLAAVISSLSLLRSTPSRHSLTTVAQECSAMSNPATIKVIPNDKLYISEPNPSWFGNGANTPSDPKWTNNNWLKSRFHFSFAEYSNAKNSDYGVLRVMNDDLVQPHRGFGTHPHRDMEIITYIVHGSLSHQDSMGTAESLGRGSIQFMTAGTGIQHSEFNHGDNPLRFIQTWIVPNQRSLKPNYGSYVANHDLKKNQLQHLVGCVHDTNTSPPVKINQEANAFAAELEMDEKVTYELPKDEQGYLLCIEGGVAVNGKSLKKYDACEIADGGIVEIVAIDTEDTENGILAHVLLFTMKAVPNSGRKDL